MVTEDASMANRASLFYFPYDGSWSAYADLRSLLHALAVRVLLTRVSLCDFFSLAEGNGSGYEPAANFHTMNRQIMVATRHGMNANKAALFVVRKSVAGAPVDVRHPRRRCVAQCGYDLRSGATSVVSTTLCAASVESSLLQPTTLLQSTALRQPTAVLATLALSALAGTTHAGTHSAAAVAATHTLTHTFTYQG